MNTFVKACIVMLGFSLIVACNSTLVKKDGYTHIPYLVLLKDLEFWNSPSRSPLVSLETFSIRVDLNNKFSVWLANPSNEKLFIASSNGEALKEVTLPSIPFEEAHLWTLIIDKAPYEVTVRPNNDIILPSKTVNYRDLFSVLHDYDAHSTEVQGVPDLLRQDFYRLMLVFEEQSTVTYTKKDNQNVQYLSDENGVLILSINESFEEENGLLSFSSLPTLILPLN